MRGSTTPMDRPRVRERTLAGEVWGSGLGLPPLPSSLSFIVSKMGIMVPLLSSCGEDEIRKRVESASVQFSRSVMSDSLRPHELQHARPTA